jgi:hypothetical protein
MQDKQADQGTPARSLGRDKAAPKKTRQAPGKQRLPAWATAWMDKPPAALFPSRDQARTRPGRAQVTDRYEQEASQAARHVMRALAPGSPASDTVRGEAPFSPSGVSLSHAAPSIQRQAIDEAAEPAEGEVELTTAGSQTSPAPATGPAGEPPSAVTTVPGLIVDDAVVMPEPGQMKKSDFLAQLQDAVLHTAQQALVGTMWEAAGCPWIEHWFGYYGGRDSQQIERAICHYVPETAGATAASDYLPAICARVRSAIVAWSTTGEITGVPAGVGTDLPAMAKPAGGQDAASGPAATGEAGSSPAATILAKGRDGGVQQAAHPQTIQAQLGPGHTLAGGVKSQVESAYGVDLSGVRVHTDTRAAALSHNLNARAFTVGPHVAFGAGEYQPGTPIGDALIAHELAHVVQQGGSREAALVASRGPADDEALEDDADASAMGAVVSAWGALRGALAGIAQSAAPRLKSGLRLQGCKKPERTLKPVGDPKAAATFGDWLKTFPEYAGGGDQDITKATPPDLQSQIAGKLNIPPDCADVSIILRHYYLKAKGQTFTFHAGPGKGKEFSIGLGVSDEQLAKNLVDLGSINFQEERSAFALVSYYKKAGVKLTNLKELLDVPLKPGDVLVWKRRPEITGNFEGHVQTVQDVNRKDGTLTVVQGNMVGGKGVGALQQRQYTFTQLTGRADANADIQPATEEFFFGAGSWS